MSDMKCPFCNKKLDYDDLLCSCINEYCEESFDMVGTEMIWQKVIDLKQELDRTRKALDVAVDALKEISLCYQNKEEHKHTDDILWYMVATDMCDYADEAIVKAKKRNQRG